MLQRSALIEKKGPLRGRKDAQKVARKQRKGASGKEGRDLHP